MPLPTCRVESHAPNRLVATQNNQLPSCVRKADAQPGGFTFVRIGGSFAVCHLVGGNVVRRLGQILASLATWRRLHRPPKTSMCSCYSVMLATCLLASLNTRVPQHMDDTVLPVCMHMHALRRHMLDSMTVQAATSTPRAYVCSCIMEARCRAGGC